MSWIPVTLEERLRATAGEIDCPRCGRVVPLIAETEAWEEDDQGVWRHDGYGPGVGECCGLVFLEQYFEGYVEIYEVDRMALVRAEARRLREQLG